MSDFPAPAGYDVYWEKWIDAFEAEEAEIIEEMKEVEDFEDYEEALDQDMMTHSHIRTIITPFGVLPITEKTRASSHFKLWVGHSNFKLTKDFYKIIGGSSGVEALDILTPYRFRIAIGKMFVDRDVMKTVRDCMVEHISGQSNDGDEK